MQTIQAAVIAAVTQIIAVIVGFGVINNTAAGTVVTAATAVVNLGFLLAGSIESHGKVTAAAAVESARAQAPAPAPVPAPAPAPAPAPVVAGK